MGTWGTGSFENDNACDWLFDLQRSADLKVVKAALTPPKGFLEAPDSELVLAGAEIVAAGLGRPLPRLPERATQWVKTHSGLDFASLVAAAREQIARVLTQSELKELWQDSEQLEDWLPHVNDLVSRLG